MGALFAHHTGHGRDADERRDEEEKEGKDIGDPRDDGGIILETCVPDVRGAVERIGDRGFERGERRVSRVNLCLLFGNLL
ncbi:MAG: hypothetical protein ACI4QG_06505, partial [Candidatus Cryptobacteroides sp.]